MPKSFLSRRHLIFATACMAAMPLWAQGLPPVPLAPAELRETETGLVLVLPRDLKLERAAGLVLFLHPDRSPDGTATDGMQPLGKLRSAKGGQQFPVPNGVEIAAFRSVVIFSEEKNQIVGVMPFGG